MSTFSIIDNNLLTTTAGVIIAYSSGNMIRSLASDIVLPYIYKVFLNKVKLVSGAFAPINKVNIDNFIKEFLSWIFVIIITYLIVNYLLKKWSSRNNINQEKDQK